MSNGMEESAPEATRAPVKHRMTRRLAGWDYRQRAIYMITVTLEERRHEWLGRLINLAKNGEARDNLAKNGEARDNLAKNGEARDSARSVPPHCCGGWAIAPTPFGETVLEALEEMPKHYPQVRILARQLMPEHFHFIVFVQSPLPKPLGALVRGFKAGAAKRWNLAKNGEAQDNLAKNGEARDNLAKNGEARDLPRWSEGFQDTVLFREGQLAAMITYLRENPERLAEKRANPDLFRRVARLELPLDGGRATGFFEALGNRHLLRRPLHQVQCSRRFFAWRREPKPGGGLKVVRDAAGDPVVERSSADYEERLAAALEAAAHGAVVLSPCISDGERQIAREALRRGLPLVALRNMGFAPLQKPVGRLFDICAEGRLLLLAPAAWPHCTQEKPMTRFDATALNRIAQWLAGEDAAEIDYHGMVPQDIDALASAAVAPPQLSATTS